MSVTLDRGRVARHEGGHVAALVIVGHRLPRRITADWPTAESFGLTEIDWETEGINRESARHVAISILCGPLAEGCEDWPPAWPIDRDSEISDVRQLAVLASYLTLSESGWDELVAEARRLSQSVEFCRLAALIARGLELQDELSADDLAWLIGEKTLTTYGISPELTKENNRVA
jgi:hypothetical protein